jgi:hypothetical protein
MIGKQQNPLQQESGSLRGAGGGGRPLYVLNFILYHNLVSHRGFISRIVQGCAAVRWKDTPFSNWTSKS